MKYTIFRSLLINICLLASISVFSQDPNFYIYLCLGQSNMDGAAKITDEYRDVDRRFQTMVTADNAINGRNKGTWYIANPPLAHNFSGLGPADFFGREMVARLPRNMRVGVLNVAIPGCKIELFDEDSLQEYKATAPDWMVPMIEDYGGNPYARLVEMARLAQKDGVIKGILLHQGESNTGEKEWCLKVKKIYDRLLKDLNLEANNVPLLAGGVVGAEQNGQCAVMNEIIATIGQTIPTAHFISSENCEAGSDRLHFTAEGYAKLGKRYAQKMLSLSVIGALNTPGQAAGNIEGSVETFVFHKATDGYFPLATNGTPANVISDEDDKGIQRVVNDLCEDLFRVTGYRPSALKPHAVVIGTIGKSKLIDRLVSEGKIDGNQLRGKTEKYIITTLKDANIDGADQVMVVAGSDKRGTIYGVYEISRQIGVSPWYWWADVPVRQQENLFVKPGVYTDGEPQVRYRGIFINDEAPAFQGWCNEKFGGVNSRMYEHMFELILRQKGNFLWPAMWGNMFFYDDPRNGELANDMGIVIGTTHHEPMGRAHEEWKVSGSGDWNYATNAATLNAFWEGGLERMKNYETLVTVGMRGDGDEAMSPTPNISLLENIVKNQRQIIQKVTGKKPELTPQVWALYKEVQDYYDQGMRVPDDVTLLLCDDNWGNVRKLPDVNAKPRKGGYGMYYHFDYVGAPRNYKWLNVSQISRTWEQMNLCYTHGVRQIWVVNVGDLKPMEYPISFFLDMAWNPERFNARNLEQWNEQWCAAQFGATYAKETARLMNLYTQYNTRVTPELLTATTYSLENYGEFERVLNDYRSLAIDAFRIYNLLPADARDAFDELVLFPINGVCNLYEMYYAVAMNRFYAAKNDLRANAFADKVKECFARDAQLTEHYNKDIADGKWAHQMDQVRIGYTQWNDPATNIMPKVEYVLREAPQEKTFIEKDNYISIEAENFAKSNGNERIRWETIPYLGRTQSGVTTMPANAYPKDTDNIYIEYLIQTQTDGEANANIWLAPTLNFNANKGLRFALSVDGGTETVVNFNGHYKGELGDWQGYRIIRSATKLNFGKAGSHTLRIRVLEPGIVFEKIMLDFGGLKPTYLGAPESDYIQNGKPFPDKAPKEVSSRADHDQMMYQVGIAYPEIDTKQVEKLRAERPKASFEGHTAVSDFGSLTNYLQTWEKEGEYYTGAQFYKPLKLHDLTGVTAASWETRRAEILAEVQKIYGVIPDAAKTIKIDWKISKGELKKEVFNMTERKFVPSVPFLEYQITGTVDVSSFPDVKNPPVIAATLRIPQSMEGKKTPVIVDFTFAMPARNRRFMMFDESLWEAAAPAGIGVLCLNPTDIQPDNGEGLTGSIIGLINKGNWRKPTDWGTLAAWGWGVSRLIDFFETGNTPVDAGRVALTGHSRYGKATLVAMAYDKRIAISFPSSAGAMGTAPTRRHIGEDIENVLNTSEYHWLAGHAMIYNGVDASSKDGYLPRKVINMPVDAESLVALCAPRPIFIGSGSAEQGEAWVDPYGQYLTCEKAGPVYELLGRKGVVMPDTQTFNGKTVPYPATDKEYLAGDIGYRRHAGGHQAAPNYPAFIRFIRKYWN